MIRAWFRRRALRKGVVAFLDQRMEVTSLTLLGVRIAEAGEKNSEEKARLQGVMTDLVARFNIYKARMVRNAA